MRLAPIVEELKAGGFRRVYGALELAGLKTQPATLPAYFVLSKGWRAGSNNLAGAHDQNVSEDFGVVIMLPAAARREDTVSDDLHAEEARVVATLAGWTHPDASRACEAVSGELLSVDGQALSWMVTFRTGKHIRKAS